MPFSSEGRDTDIPGVIWDTSSPQSPRVFSSSPFLLAPGTPSAVLSVSPKSRINGNRRVKVKFKTRERLVYGRGWIKRLGGEFGSDVGFLSV